MAKQLSPHTKTDLSTSTRSKGSSTLGPDHSGKPKDGFFAAKGLTNHTEGRVLQSEAGNAHELGHRGHPTGSVMNGQTIRNVGAIDVQARAGAPKVLNPVPFHAGTTDAQIATVGKGGLGHATSTVIPDASSASPLDIESAQQRGKNFPTPALAHDQRHDATRNPTFHLGGDMSAHIELGQRILNEATLSGSTKLRNK
ncbi:MAG TPA: hypothetical protein VMV19_18230 [Xanthobacteraceae bacterium]|nr:hypothetical protein [Xanthobacteraceae bacterium]